MSVTDITEWMALMEQRMLSVELRRQPTQVVIASKVTASEATSNSSGFGVDLATVGPEITIPTPGKWLVEYGALTGTSGSMNGQRVYLDQFDEVGNYLTTLHYADWNSNAGNGFIGVANGPNPMPHIIEIFTAPVHLRLRYGGFNTSGGSVSFSDRILKAMLTGG